MKKVFIVILKGFFIQNNIDYAAAVDNQQIKVFSKRTLAEKCAKELLEGLKFIYASSIKDIMKGNDGYVVFHYDGSRNVIDIIEKELSED